MRPGKPPLTQFHSIHRRQPTHVVHHVQAGAAMNPRPLFSYRPPPRYAETQPYFGTRRDNSRNTPLPSVRQALDPQTRGMAKDIFKLIQAIHHKQIIDNAIITGTFRSGMTRQVTRLTAFN